MCIRDRFGADDFSKWPFWKRGDAYHNRGQAYILARDGAKAEADLSAALPWISEPRTRDSVLLRLAQNREQNLDDEDGALEAYHRIVDGSARLGASDQFSALQGIARILTLRGQFDDALKTLARADHEKMQGVWNTNIQKSIDAVNAAQREGGK